MPLIRLLGGPDRVTYENCLVLQLETKVLFCLCSPPLPGEAPALHQLWAPAYSFLNCTIPSNI